MISQYADSSLLQCFSGPVHEVAKRGSVEMLLMLTEYAVDKEAMDEVRQQLIFHSCLPGAF